jgi:hypothetical protein
MASHREAQTRANSPEPPLHEPLSPGTRTCAQLRRHVGRTPLRRGVKLGLLRVGVSAPSAPSTRYKLYSSVIASILRAASGWGCSYRSSRVP